MLERIMKFLLSAIVLAGLVLATARAEEAAYPVFPLQQAPAMDGKWNGPAWEDIPEATGFLNIKSGGLISTRQTSFKMGWYGSNLYLAVKCEEPDPAKVKFDANNYRDGYYPDDNLEIFFSRDKSPKGFRQFVTNSRGARWSNFACPNAAEAWQSASDQGADSWSVEVKMPFSQLGIGDDFKTTPIWFNMARNSSRNEDKEKASSFAPVKNAFADVDRFAALAFRDAPGADELAQARKRLNRLGNWARDRLWKIANVKEPFLADKSADDNVRQLLDLKKQAKTMLESKDFGAAMELIKRYDQQVGEINAPTKRLVVQVRNRDATTRLYLDGTELQPDSSGKCIAKIKEGVSVLAAESAASGDSPAVQVEIEGMPETASRWKVSPNEEKGWLDSAFNDSKWPAAAVKDVNFLWAAEPAAKIFLRQVILWNNTHDGDLRCIIPPVKEWGFSENSTDTLFLALYSPLTFPLGDYAFQLDMPLGFELLDMNKTTNEGSSRGGTYKINCTPENVTKVPVEHQGVPYNRYTIKYKKGAIPNPGPRESTYFSMLPVKLNKWNSDKKETCFYYARLAQGNLTEIGTKLPVRILPPINGRMLNKIRIQQYCGSPYFGSTLSDRHLEEHIKTATSAGFNYWQVNAYNDYGKKFNKMLVDAKASLIAAQSFNYPIWGNVGVNGALLNLLKTRPEFQAKYFNNTSAQDKGYQRYCPSYVTIGEGRSAFKDAVKKDFKEKFFDPIPQSETAWINWESQSWQQADSYTKARKGDESYCFCDRCKKA
ncbi:MAG: sugar-binding protein, partial [Phycisphaerae bacterium]